MWIQGERFCDGGCESAFFPSLGVLSVVFKGTLESVQLRYQNADFPIQFYNEKSVLWVVQESRLYLAVSGALGNLNDSILSRPYVWKYPVFYLLRREY